MRTIATRMISGGGSSEVMNVDHDNGTMTIGVYVGRIIKDGKIVKQGTCIRTIRRDSSGAGQVSEFLANADLIERV